MYNRNYYTGPKQVAAGITLKREQHQALADHCVNLLASSADERRRRVSEQQSIEMDLLGVADPTEKSECERAQKRAEGRGASTPDRIYPFAYYMLRRYAADISSMIMPFEAPYQVAVAVADQQKANAVTKALRHQSAVFDHRNNVNACIYDGLAFDFFAFDVREEEAGSTINTPTGPGEHAEKGFAVRHLDPYNVCYDASVKPHMNCSNGEFIAVIDQINLFQTQLLNSQSHIFINKQEREHLKSQQTDRRHTIGNSNGDRFYVDPDLNRARLAADNNRPREGEVRRDFSTLFTSIAFANETGKYSVNSLEMIHMQVRLDPTEWGLRGGPATGLEIYEICMIENMIVSARKAPNQNNFSMRVGSLSYDRPLGRHVAMGDTLADLNAYMSNTLNVHKRSQRKGLEGGVTIYNPEFIPLEKLDDMHGGRLPAADLRHDSDIRKHVLQLNDVPDVKNTMQDVQGILGLMQGLVPTDSQPELAGLDRATEFQAQAVAMTGDRLLYMDASLFDGQLIGPVRQQLQWLMMHADYEMFYLDEESQQSLGSLTPEDRKSLQFRLVQPSIFIGIDKLRSSNLLTQMANISLQVGDQISPLAAFLLRHLMSISGSVVNMEDYERAIQETQEREQQRVQAENPTNEPPQPSAAGGGQQR